jgi:chitinase
LGYNEICEELMESDESDDDSESWTVEWEDNHKAPYMFKGLKWVAYDNQESIRIKTNFAYQQGLAGVMTWSIDTDDFAGKCGGPTYPLLRTINHALYEMENGLYRASGSIVYNSLMLTVTLAMVLQLLL